MDKVQKIKEWISKTQDGLMDDNGNFENTSDEGAFHILSNLDYYIDTLQEETVSGSIDFEQELYKAFGQIKDFTLGMRIAKWFYDMGKKSLEPVSEELEEAVNAYIGYAPEVDESSSTYSKRQAFKAGAKWQFDQLEKNRLAACDKQTEEEAEIERDFVMNIVENEHRQPTFDDAIKYGMKLQEEQMVAKAIDAHCFGLQGAALFSFRLPADNYLVGSEVKVIVIKGD